MNGRGSSPLRVAVLLSGSGRTFDNLLARQRAGRLPIEIVVVVASRGDVLGVAKAKAAGIPLEIVRRRDAPDPAAYGAAIGAVLSHWRTELTVMAGFLHLWTIPPKQQGRVMNIHPSLLPAFGGKGMHGDAVHAAVLAAGAKVTGCTVHFADDRYDSGPIILQRTAPVLDDDDAHSLAARVFEQECVAYPEAIALFAAGRLALDGRHVRLVTPS